MRKNEIKRKTMKKIATMMMAAAMVVSGGFGIAPTANQTAIVRAAESTTTSDYLGYHAKSTKTEKKPATTSTKKSSLSKNYKNKKTETTINTHTETALDHVLGKDSKKVTKTVTTTTKVYYKKTLTTTIKKEVTITTTTVNYVRSGSADYMKLVGNKDTQIPIKIGNALKADGYKVVIDPDNAHDGVFSPSRKTIFLKKNVDYALMHEMGHYVNFKEDYISESTEFKDIYNAEKAKYKGFYSEMGLSLGSYGQKSSSEYFAECFRDYYFSANSRSKLKTNCPKTYSFIQKAVNNF